MTSSSNIISPIKSVGIDAPVDEETPEETSATGPDVNVAPAPPQKSVTLVLEPTRTDSSLNSTSVSGSAPSFAAYSHRPGLERTFGAASHSSTSNGSPTVTNKKKSITEVFSSLPSAFLRGDSNDSMGGKMSQHEAVGLGHALRNTNHDSELKNNKKQKHVSASSSRSGIRNSLVGLSTRHLGSISHQETVETLEAIAVKKATSQSSIWTVLRNFYAALRVYAFYLITPESLLASIFAAGMTYYWFTVLKDKDDGSLDGRMNMVLLTFAIITPMSASIRMAFTRREQALREISKFRSFSQHIYTAHSTWDWSRRDRGRKALAAELGQHIWCQHSDRLLEHIIGMGDEMCRYLSLPTSSRGRHRFTMAGRKEALRTSEVAYRLFDSVNSQRITRIGQLTEELKAFGLSETECSRIHQFERYVSDACENLRFLKSYRTPEALRTFARLFIFFLPPLYAPSFAQVAVNLDTLAMGLILGILTTLGLGALFESIEILEDPFVGFAVLDGIDVNEEFHVLHWQQLINIREVIFPDAPTLFPTTYAPALMASLRTVRMEGIKLWDANPFQESSESMGIDQAF